MSEIEAQAPPEHSPPTAAARLRVLGQASRTFSELDLDLGRCLRGVVTELARALDGCVNIALIEPDGLLHLTAVRHPNPEAQAFLETLSRASPLRMGEGVTGEVAATGESILVPHVDAQLSARRAPQAYREFLERFPAYAVIGAPLRARGRVIGTVTATRVRTGESFNSEDLSLLEELAERAAVAIENSRLYQETLDARSRAEHLYGFAQSVVAAEDQETVFDAALHSVEAVLGASRAAILTFDDEDVMRFRAWHRLSDEYRGAMEGHSPWTRTASSPEPILVPDVHRDAQMAAYAPLLRREGISALAFIPLLAGGTLLGKVMVYYDQEHPFSSPEVEAARALANHLASVIARFAAVHELKATIRYNELFAGVLAHDLRNPLGAIMTGTQLIVVRRRDRITEGEMDDDLLSRILSSGQRMGTMIDQLLELTRARAGGGIDVRPGPTNLGVLCAQAVAELELAHPHWRIHTQVVGDQNGTWDAERLLQLISNLIANAGQHGTPRADIRIALDGAQIEHIRFDIHNEGSIPKALLPHIFDPFRSTQHRRDQSSGLGLGLFIVREIVRAHGGAVDVASSEVSGTTFSIRLPRHRPTTPAG